MNQNSGNKKGATPTSESAQDTCDQANDNLTVLPSTRPATNQPLDDSASKQAEQKTEPQPITRRGGSFAGD